MGVLVVVPLVQRAVIDGSIELRRHPLLPLLLLLASLGFLRFFTTLVRRYSGGRVSFDVQLDLRNAIFDHLHELDFAVHDGLQTGQLVSRANSDLSLVQQLLAWTPMVIGSLIQALASLVVMLVLSPPLFAVALFIPTSTFAIAWRMRRTVFPSSWDAQSHEAEVTTVAEETISGVRVVKAFGREQDRLERFISSVRAMFGSRLRNIRLRSRYSAHLQSVPAIGQVAILALGGWLAIRGNLSIGTFVAFATYLTQLAGPARMMAGILAVGQQARAGAERITELLDLTPTLKERPDAKALHPVKGQVSFDDVTFGYPVATTQADGTVVLSRGEPVLKEFSLSIKPGESVALVGLSGSGKSTVCMLLPRFYDVEKGSVSIDGHDVSSVRLDSLRRQVGIVLEESFLFAASVRDNIAFGNPDATEDEVEAAARIASAHEFIMSLPDGYDTVVGETGVTLSGGQRQRLALARTLLVDPRVLILDDATSAVDAETEARIYQSLSELHSTKTMLVVAHRRSTLQLVDRVALLDGGKVVDQGTFTELISRSTLFRELMGSDGSDRSPTELASQDRSHKTAGSSTTKRERAGSWMATSMSPGSGAFPAAAQPGSLRMGAATAMGLRAGMRAGVGMGGWGGQAGGHGWLQRPPTAELEQAIAKLPPIKDFDKVDVTQAARDSSPLLIRRFARPWTRQLLIGLLLVTLDALAGLAGPYLIRYGLDLGVLHRATAVLLAFSGAYAIVTVFDWWDMWAENVWTGRTGERMLLALRIRIFAHLQRLGMDYYERELTGRIITRVTNDVETLSQLLQNGLVNALVGIGTFVGIAIVMFAMDVRLALIAMAAVPLLVLATIWFRQRSAVAYDRQRDRVSALNAHLQESISGIRVTQAFVREAGLYETYQELGVGYRKASLTALRIQATYVAFSDLLGILTMVAVLGVGSDLVTSRAIPIGVLVAFLLYVTQFFNPIQQLAQTFDSYQRARAGMRKLSSLLEEPVTIKSPSHPIKISRPTGELTLANVAFRYPGALQDALHDVNLSVAPGEQVALVGPTGAGKSTIVKLVARFYDPTQGQVVVDGCPLDQIDLAWWRRHLGYVPQEPFLFAASVRDNIAFGKPDASDAEVEAVASMVGVHEAILNLSGGYRHIVSERGRSLSAGERQLVCLARALLVEPLVLLLDEATANLDLVAEAKVARAMEAAAKGRTTLVIAHRLDTARRADRIVVIGKGTVLEEGTHEALLSAGGAYGAMWAAAQGAAGDKESLGELMHQPTQQAQNATGGYELHSA